MLSLTERAVDLGYTLMWDADVSNSNFRQAEGFAMQWKNHGEVISPDDEETSFDQASRQVLFENLTTQDDHLMHLVGLEKSPEGKKFFKVKNSWGQVGPFKGFILVSEAYYAMNTISLVVPREVLSSSLKAKLGITE
jgi:bleomycin hydrolase